VTTSEYRASSDGVRPCGVDESGPVNPAQFHARLLAETADYHLHQSAKLLELARDELRDTTPVAFVGHSVEKSMVLVAHLAVLESALQTVKHARGRIRASRTTPCWALAGRS
jgi:hypothetical protein